MASFLNAILQFWSKLAMVAVVIYFDKYDHANIKMYK